MIIKEINDLEPLIKTLFDEYSFLGYSKEEFDNLVKNILKENIGSIEDTSNLSNKQIKKCLIDGLNTYINKNTECINKFIEKNINEVFEPKGVLGQLNKIESFFTKYHIEPKMETIESIIKKNSSISNMLKMYVEKYKELIQSGKTEQICQDEFMLLFIEIYCMLYDIGDLTLEKQDEDTEDSSSDNLNYDGTAIYMRQLSSKVLTREEEVELFNRLNLGDQSAKELIVKHNERLVLSIAKKYQGRGLDLMDLQQEGLMGLLKAIDKFDVSKGHKFSTVATWWIRQAIQRSIADTANDIRIPSHIYESTSKYKKAYEFLIQSNIKPTLERIAEYSELSIDLVKKISEAQTIKISLDQPLKVDESDTDMYNFIADDTEALDETIMSSDFLRNVFNSCNLSDKEKTVIMYRVKLDGSKPKTLEEVGEMLGVTRERARQIESKALKKLRQTVEEQRPVRKSASTNRHFSERSEPASLSDSGPTNSMDKDISMVKKRGKVMKEQLQNKKIFVSLYELLPEYTKEQIDIVIQTLHKDDNHLLYLRYGNDLSNPSPVDNWDDLLEKRFNEKLLPKIKKSLNILYNNVSEEVNDNEKELQCIYELFPEYTKEQVDSIIEILNEGNKLLLNLKYGEDLSNPKISNEWNDELEKIFNEKLLLKIKELLHLVYKKIDYKRRDRKLNLKTIYEKFPEYNKEQVNRAIETLDEYDKALLLLRYGRDLNNPIFIREFEREETYQFYHLLFPKLTRKLEKMFPQNNIENNEKETKKCKTIYELLSEYTEEQINIVIASLNEGDKNLLNLRYGDDLHNPISSEEWNKSHNNKFYGCLLRKIKTRLKYLNEASQANKKIQSIYELLPEYTEEQIDSIIATLNEEDKHLLNLKYGKDLSDPKTSDEWNDELEKRFMDGLLPHIKTSLQLIYNKEKSNKKIKTIYELLPEYTEEQIDIVIASLNERDKNLLNLRYGEDLHNPIFSEEWNRSYTNKFYGCLFPKIKNRLKNLNKDDQANKKIQSIYELYPEYTEEQIDSIIVTLNEEDKHLLSLKYGNDLSNPKTSDEWNDELEKTFNEKLLPKIITSLNELCDIKEPKEKTVDSEISNTQEFPQVESNDLVLPENNEDEQVMSKNDYISFLKLLKTPSFTDIMNSIDVKSAVILVLKLGYIDEKYFTDESIANFLGIPEDEVASTFEQSLIVYKDYINTMVNKTIEFARGNQKVHQIENK